MLVRVLLGLVALVLPGAAFAQGACVPRDTPDIAASARAPTVFPHCIAEGKCGAVDKAGAWRIPPKYIDVVAQDEFILVPEDNEWTKFGFLDETGKRLGGGEYNISMEESLPVSEGLLQVTVDGKTGFVDRTGTLVIPAEFGYAWAFENGLSASERNGVHGFIDKTGKTVITAPEGFDDLSGFVGDVAVAGKQGKYGLIGRDGKVVIEPRFDSLYSDGGVLVATDGEKTGLIDQTGAWIGTPELLAVGVFSKGLAPAQRGEKWGFIDTCANWKIEPKYDQAVGFEGGPARVMAGDKWGLIDQAGTEIFAPTASYIGEGLWIDGLIAFSNDDTLFGLLDTSGKVAMEPKYESLEPLGGGVLQAFEGEEAVLLNLDGTPIQVAPAP